MLCSNPWDDEQCRKRRGRLLWLRLRCCCRRSSCLPLLCNRRRRRLLLLLVQLLLVCLRDYPRRMAHRISSNSHS